MQDRAEAGLKLAAGSAAIHSLTCWPTPVGRSAKLVSSAELALTPNAQAAPNRGPAETTYRSKETLMTKLVLALALAFATLATVPATAGPYCQEDLGYGRTSSFGCGG